MESLKYIVFNTLIMTASIYRCALKKKKEKLEERLSQAKKKSSNFIQMCLSRLMVPMY
jgi:hypothetical protein